MAEYRLELGSELEYQLREVGRQVQEARERVFAQAVRTEEIREPFWVVEAPSAVREGLHMASMFASEGAGPGGPVEQGLSLVLGNATQARRWLAWEGEVVRATGQPEPWMSRTITDVQESLDSLAFLSHMGGRGWIRALVRGLWERPWSPGRPRRTLWLSFRRDLMHMFPQRFSDIDDQMLDMGSEYEPDGELPMDAAGVAVKACNGFGSLFEHEAGVSMVVASGIAARDCLNSFRQAASLPHMSRTAWAAAAVECLSSFVIATADPL